MNNEDANLEELVPELRQFVEARLEAGAAPQDLSYALSLVATELGICVTDGSLTVLPTVLKGISDAVSVYSEEIDSQAQNAPLLVRPKGAPVH